MGKGADFSLLRVARRRRDAIDGFSKNTVDASYCSPGSHDGYCGIHPSAAVDGGEFVEAQFVVQIGHENLPFCPGGETIPASRNHRSTPVCERVM
jgi:hypothetical protein